MTLSVTEVSQIRSLPLQTRQTPPLVHCLTNQVVSNFTANILLALGASPAMVTAIEETAEFAAIASALLINIGTIDTPRYQAMREAIAGANKAGKPWVFDPITAGLPFRMKIAAEFIAEKPAVIRGNASEIMSLASLANTSFKGIDSKAGSEEALNSAQQLAKDIGTVVAVSGEVDYVTDGQRIIKITGGHPLMTKVTGVGCALNAVIAAYIAVAKDPFLGTIAALAAFSQCGSEAAFQAEGTGSFSVAFLDRLTQLQEISGFGSL
ncbi:hydroxyethylthiazole kinase [Microvirga sp. W0021]|uniref:Hydroxyethylthiazole kinase n=1 Tax=Hohaiivirga grylli TaxID=3133970 RepID=A0ABV0BNC8_9HYPH